MPAVMPLSSEIDHSPPASPANALRILIADDDMVSRMKLRRVLERELGAEVIEARDGDEAWRLFCREPVSMVVSDWMMPGLDGPDLCKRIRRAAVPFYTYFILLTSREGQGYLVQGMDSGADDYVQKPFDSAELRSRVLAGQRVVELEHSLAVKNYELEQAIDAASKVQRSMLPTPSQLMQTSLESGVAIAYQYRACQNLGGDVLGMVRQGSGRDFSVFLADVSGHGIAASLSAVSLYTYLHTLISADPEPISVVAQANRFCSESFPEHVYATMIYMRFCADSRSVDVVVAGHPALIRVDRHGNCSQFSSSFPPLGLFDDQPGPEDVQRIVLAPGDRLLAYTDGVIETGNSSGEMFDERLPEMVQRLASATVEEMAERIMQGIEQWRGEGRDFLDDISIVAVGSI